MHGKIESVTNELTIVVVSNGLQIGRDAVADAAEYIAERHPGENWIYVDIDLSKGGDGWSIRYRRPEPEPNERRRNGPDWATT